ncbi:60S ribosome subunit biogenesis protein nip7 [Psilocybe cubensis]|uniref:60S ribosome subunit biogenesis protein nip7 n=1 Tax=Psilocybe cubensis TaxID=181762 RepID=A0ACB8HFI8_PSICU|nr:60S ribosome subunit biogenesis protein nip7 [Psilocybe cubensis]KAH9486616.1 60S ribosome subunit biogenesis protein nip7 [Psilocybe cubensis]
MRPLTEEESKAVFTKLANYIGKNLVHLIDRPDEPYCFRLHRDRVYYVSESSMRLGISVARPNLVSLGTCFGKFSKSGKFKLHITSLDYVAQYAKYKIWIKPNGEMPFLYGNHVVKAHLGKITEDTPEHQGVVVYSMKDIPLGFGVTARSTVDTRKLDPTAIIVFHQANDMLFPSTTSWTALNNDQLTAENVDNILGRIHDDLWVVSACVDRLLNDTPTQRALLTLGISRTERVVARCNDIIAQASPPQPLSPNGSLEAMHLHFKSSPTDALLCHFRQILLQRLDRLNTYVEMEAQFPRGVQTQVEETDAEWEDDPWADENPGPTSKPTPLPNSVGPPPLCLADFLQNDLLWSACQLASLEAIDALRVLCEKHGTALWPCRFKILDCIPEHIHPSTCRSILPSLDASMYREAVWQEYSWRKTRDISELPDVQEAIQIQISSLPTNQINEEVSFSGIAGPLTAEELSNWYKNRVNIVIKSTGAIDLALAMVQHGASQGIPQLDELGEELSLLSRLVYDAPQGPNIDSDWTLDQWYSMDALAVVRAYLANSTSETIAYDISRLVMPYLFVLEARAERAGIPDPSLPTRILHQYVLSTSLELAAAIFNASKPTLPTSQRIIKDDEDMARLALALLYASDSLTEWSIMSSIFECLPVWDVSRDVNSDEEAADTTVASLGAFVTPSTNQPPCSASDLLLFFQPLPFTSLSRALDILDVHLESGEILSRWSVPAPLRWFLQSSGDIKEQRAWANRMARRAGGKYDKLSGIEDWEWLLGDMEKLTGGGDPNSRGAFYFEIAKRMLYGPHHKLTLNAETIESVCLSCSREFYDNANSGNYKVGDMKLAYDCLEVPHSSDTIVKEKDFIEATSRICSFNVPSKHGLTITPLEIRLTKDRLNLVSRVISSNADAYKHAQVILELSNKLGYAGDSVAEVKVLAMLADTALQAEDFTRAYENNERMVRTVTELRHMTTMGSDDDRVKEASEVCWIACYQLGRQQEYDDLPKKMTLLGYALELCPPDQINEVLSAWRKLERENSQAHEAKLQRRRTGDTVLNSRKTDNVPGNVASSLRARLQDFHVPSPPLLSTPDAAALASRTFKSVAANFPFGVGHRARSQVSDTDGRGSPRSESSRRTDGEDVSSQASRVLSKGIGWLIGADEGI